MIIKVIKNTFFILLKQGDIKNLIKTDGLKNPLRIIIFIRSLKNLPIF